MTSDHNQQEARNKQASRITSRLYSIGFLTVLFLLFVSVMANTSMTEDMNQLRGKNQAGCDPSKAKHPVKITFNGLFYFSFSKSKEKGDQYRSECRVGILSQRPDHMLYMNFDGVPDTSMLIFPHPALQSLPEEIEINKYVGESPSQSGVTIEGGFTESGDWGYPPDRNKLEGENNFNWIIDFESKELHGENIDEKPNALRPTLKIKTGNFRTGKLSKPYKFYIIRSGHHPVARNFGYVAATIEAVISLEPNEYLKIKVGDHDYCVPENTKQIYLDNVRPEYIEDILKDRKQSPNYRAAGAKVDMQELHTNELHIHDDLPIYYDNVLNIADAKERFHFIPVLPVLSQASQRAVPFICFSTGGSK
jgi:hypothetical protein